MSTCAWGDGRDCSRGQACGWAVGAWSLQLGVSKFGVSQFGVSQFGVSQFGYHCFFV